MNLIPQYIAEKAAKQEFAGKLEAAVLMIDLSGSVALCEKLMQFGKEGLEKLSSIINHLFTSAIETIYNSGGFVSLFAGDSITAIFPTQWTDICTILGSIRNIISTLVDSNQGMNKFGVNKIDIRFGLAVDQLFYKIINYDKGFSNYIFYGQAADLSSSALEMAEKGEIILDKSAALLLPESLVRILRPKHTLFLLPPIFCPPVVNEKTIYNYQVDTNVLDRFIPNELTRRNIFDEFKNVASIFISLQKNSRIDRNLVQILNLALQYRGFVNSLESGDKGFVCFVQFGVPFVEENYLQEALHFILAVQKILQKDARISITEGKVFTGFIGNHIRSSYSCIGSSVNLASRIMMQANWGQILVCESIYNKTEKKYCFTNGQSFKLKGISDRQIVFELTGINVYEQKEIDSVFLGREKNLQKIDNFYDKILTEKKSGIYYLGGSAGIGKTRLLTEFVKCHKEHSCYKFSCHFAKTGNFLPFKSIIEFQLIGSNGIEINKMQFDNYFHNFCQQYKLVINNKFYLEKLKKLQPIIGYLLGIKDYAVFLELLPISERNQALLTTICDFIGIVLQISNLTIVIDNCQWLDDDSQQVITNLSKFDLANSLFILLSGRFTDNSKFEKKSADLNFIVDQDELQRLNSKDAYKLITGLQKTKFQRKYINHIVNVTAGNPFYINQYCQMYSNNHKIEKNNIPMAVENILSARLDNLPNLLADIVKLAVVIGSEFTTETLFYLCRKKNEHRRLTKELFLNILKLGQYEKIWTANGKDIYTFDQLLFQEAAYQRQLRSSLIESHKILAEWFDDNYADSSENQSQAAYHYFNAALMNKALEKYKVAAEANIKDYQAISAIKNFTEAENSALSLENPDYAAVAELKYRKGEIYEQNLADYNRAEATYRQTLDFMDEKSLSDEILKAKIYNHIGIVYQYTSKLDKALEYYNLCYELRKKNLGEAHPETARILNNLGIICTGKGDFETALKYYTKAIAVLYDASPDANHLLIASASLNLGNLYLKIKPELALRYYQKAYDVYVQYLPECHHNIGQAANNLGEYYKNTGEFAKALDFHNQALAIRKKIYGRYHPLTAASISNQSEIYRLLGDYEKALKLQKQSVSIKEKILGLDNSSTATGYNNLGLLYKLKEHDEIALKYFKRAYKIWLTILGKNHPNLALVLSNMANLCSNDADFDKALAYFEEALTILKTNYPTGHRNQINILLGISEVYNITEQYDKMLQILLDAELLVEKFSLKNSLLDSTILNNLATAYLNLNQPSLALIKAENSRKIVEEKLGTKHPETALVYLTLGDTYLMLKDYLNSQTKFMSAIYVFKEDDYKNLPSTADAYFGIGKLCLEIGDADDANQSFKEALNIYKKNKNYSKSPFLVSRLAELEKLVGV